MKIHNRYLEALSSVKVSFNKKIDRYLINILIGLNICEKMGLKPGDYINVGVHGRELSIIKSEDEKSIESYKVQDIQPKTRNNYRVQFTWKYFKPRESDMNARIVGSELLSNGVLKINF